MLFKSFFTSLSLAATLAFSARADTIAAYNGTDCTGSVGNSVQCDGSCHDFTDRHSLKTSTGGIHCVTYFQSPGCVGTPGQDLNTNIINSGQCQHVNTGGPVKSFKCSPTPTCLAWYELILLAIACD
ncbi:hypothetical protein CVT25_013524 [Psilocybe cyanescens]|uniref:Cyanovirin-N domain-containing protein n=1 Tax=Psilocybe cyanescens TaxID=93625 RepID=A0A409XSN2_PSICY|nr:hypothetical protein CVT25_013524 [Psilocybe cyanescens]